MGNQIQKDGGRGGKDGNMNGFVTNRYCTYINNYMGINQTRNYSYYDNMSVIG